MNIIIITPVRNEEKYINFTIDSILSQTLLPTKWIIVDDGSQDNTGKIIQPFLKTAHFMEYIYIKNRGYRKPGSGVVEAFYDGFRRIENTDYEIVAKMDGDLEFGQDTLDRLVRAFADDPMLGIAGAPRYEQLGKLNSYRRVLVPKGYVGGPFKFYRRKCFKDIGGLIPRAGWDGVDIVRAKMNGWRAGEIESLKIYHLKPTGTAKGEGLTQACEKYGDISYFMGGYFWYFLLRAIGRSLVNRNARIGLFMIKGYYKSKRNKVERESPDFRAALKRIQQENIIFWLKKLLKPSEQLV